jgi:hypothetical protein
MFTIHDYAFQIETTTRAIFNCDRYGFGGIADADFIEKQPFIAISIVLGNFYNKIDSNSKNEIDDFFEKYYSEVGKGISEIGKEKIERIIKDFNYIVSKI